MSDLVEFVLAQIADDEAAARKIAARVAADPGSFVVIGLAHPELAAGDCPSDLGEYDLARVLADCAAKRAIVEWHKSWPVLVEAEPEFTSDTSDLNSISFAMSQRMMLLTAQEYRARFGDEPPTAPILRLLAQPYADRPGFDPAWKVET